MISQDMQDKLESAFQTIDCEGGGRLLISKNEDGTWMVGMEWGKEADDSPMAGAAAYGLENTLYEALEAALGDAGR